MRMKIIALYTNFSLGKSSYMEINSDYANDKQRREEELADSYYPTLSDWSSYPKRLVRRPCRINEVLLHFVLAIVPFFVCSVDPHG